MRFRAFGELSLDVTPDRVLSSSSVSLSFCNYSLTGSPVPWLLPKYEPILHMYLDFRF